MKDNNEYPSTFVSHLERARKERDRILARAFCTEEDEDAMKKFSHKLDVTKDLFYNVYNSDVADMLEVLPKKDYTLVIADIPYGFRMAGSSYDETPFLYKQLDKMIKDFAHLTTALIWRIVIFHSMDQGYSVSQALRSTCHGVENLAW